jgi:hypothetical protein
LRRPRLALRAPQAPWLSLALMLLLAGPLAAASRYPQGERIQVTGIVSDKQGRPLENVRVVLEVSRSYFSFREFRRAAKDVRRVSASTNAKGEYTLVWPWDSYFNRFELLVGVPVRKTTGERLEVLEREDLTQRVLAGNPTVAAVVIDNTRFLENLRAFVASVQSEDERRVYDEMGKPDEVKRIQYPDHVEASWWYFDSGKVYRFRDGRLEQVVPFDPVKGP